MYVCEFGIIHVCVCVCVSGIIHVCVCESGIIHVSLCVCVCVLCVSVCLPPVGSLSLFFMCVCT